MFTINYINDLFKTLNLDVNLTKYFSLLPYQDSDSCIKKAMIRITEFLALFVFVLCVSSICFALSVVLLINMNLKVLEKYV